MSKLPPESPNPYRPQPDTGGVRTPPGEGVSAAVFPMSESFGAKEHPFVGPETGRVIVNLPCHNCSYNLRGLAATELCPECGFAIANSLRGDVLAAASPEYLANVRSGVNWIVGGMIAHFAVQLVMSVAVGVMVATTALQAAPTPGPAGGAAPIVAPTSPQAPVNSPNRGSSRAGGVAPGAVVDGSGSDPAVAAAGQAGTAPATPQPVPGRGAVPPWFARSSAWATSQAIALIPTLVLALGYWRYTTPDPGRAHEEQPRSARRVVRACAVVIVASATVALVSTLAIGRAMFLPGGFTLSVAGTAAGALMQAVVGVTSCVLFFAVMNYTIWLARRIPDREIERHASRGRWGLPMIYILGSCVMIGPLVAGVLYCVLLWMVRRRIQLIESSRPAGMLV